MIGVPAAHVGGVPIEETLGSLGPVLLVGFGLAWAKFAPACAGCALAPPSPPPARDAGPRGRAGQSESNSDDELVANAERHVADAHADLIGKLSRNDSLVSASKA